MSLKQICKSFHSSLPVLKKVPFQREERLTGMLVEMSSTTDPTGSAPAPTGSTGSIPDANGTVGNTTASGTDAASTSTPTSGGSVLSSACFLCVILCCAEWADSVDRIAGFQASIAGLLGALGLGLSILL